MGAWDGCLAGDGACIWGMLVVYLYLYTCLSQLKASVDNAPPKPVYICAVYLQLV